MNPEEVAFETSIYHYFMYKANEQASAAARQAAQTNNAQNKPPSTNDKESPAPSTNGADANGDDDGNKKMPAAKSPQSDSEKTPSDMSGEKDTTKESTPAPAPAAFVTATNKSPPTGTPVVTGQAATLPQTTPPTVAAGMSPLGPCPPQPAAAMYPQANSPFPGMAPVPPPGGYPFPPNTMIPGFVPQPFPPQLPPGAPTAMNGQFPPTPGQVPAPQPLTIPPGMPASVMAEKYKKVLDVIRQEFPENANKLPPNAAAIRPEVWFRYTLYPRVQREASILREEKEFVAQPRKRGRPRKDAAGGPPTKKPNTGKYARIATRRDVPEDVKELLASIRTESRKEKNNMKQKIARLEAKVVSTKEKLDQKKPPPAAARPAALPTRTPVVPMPPPKPRAPPKPVGPPATFESRFKELEEYKRINNTVRVPQRLGGLGRWVSELRRNYRQIRDNPDVEVVVEANAPPNRLFAASELTKERMDRLDEIGFEFDVAKKQLPWQARFEQLLAYKAETGHCNVPRHYKPNPSLGEWVHRQRESYAKGEKIIQGERTDKLNSVGFMWRTGTRGQKYHWEERIDQCREFRREHGHLKVPPPIDPNRVRKAKAKSETIPEYEAQSEDERGFRWWAFRQREYYRNFQEGKKSTLDKKRIRELDQLGFDWSERGYYGSAPGGKKKTIRRDKNVYAERLAQLQKVKDLYGDCNNIRFIEKVFPSEEERAQLLAWAKHQRRHWRLWKSDQPSPMTPERRQLLQDLEFNFEPRKHYAPYGSKKKAAEEAEAQAVGDDEDEEDDEEEDSTMRDYRYIHGESMTGMM